MPDYDEEADALGSFRVAMDEIGRRVRAGEPLVATGYFARPNERRDLFPDPLPGRLATTVAYIWLFLDDLPCRIGWHRWVLSFPYWGLMSNNFRCRACGATRSESAHP
jgi:hypothetical protein